MANLTSTFIKQGRWEKAKKLEMQVMKISQDAARRGAPLHEFYPLTLEHIVACKAFPDQQQLAVIMSQFILPALCIWDKIANNPQFLDGLSYLVLPPWIVPVL